MNTQKPVFILIHGFSSSNLWWNYKDTGKNKLTKLNFVRNLKKLGDVYEHTMEYFNINYYYTNTNENDSEKEKKRIIKIDKKYKPYTSDLDFKIEDLYYDNICKKIHNNVIEEYGSNRKYILVCHSYGSIKRC